MTIPELMEKMVEAAAQVAQDFCDNCGRSGDKAKDDLDHAYHYSVEKAAIKAALTTASQEGYMLVEKELIERAVSAIAYARNNPNGPISKQLLVKAETDLRASMEKEG